MRRICIQVQPDRSPGVDMEEIISAFAAVASSHELVTRHSFGRDESHESYFNFVFDTVHALRLWETIQARMYEDAVFGHHMKRSSIATCTGEDGWNDYLLLFHFDPGVRLDSTSALGST